MRVRIIFALKNKGATVPFHHQSLLSGFIQAQMIGSKQQDYIYYNFSGLKGQTKVSRTGLHFYSSKVTLVVSSPNQEWIDAFLSAVFSHQELEIGSLQLIPEFIELEEAPLLSNPTKYICISPVVIVGKDQDNYQAKKFVSPEDDAFSDLLYENIIKQMENTGVYSQEQLASFYKFQLVPDKYYLQKIKADEKKFARIYTIQQAYERIEFRGYTFPFMLYAHELVQRFVFECGLGCYTQEGFGMIDTVQADFPKTTTLYTISQEMT